MGMTLAEACFNGKMPAYQHAHRGAALQIIDMSPSSSGSSACLQQHVYPAAAKQRTMFLFWAWAPLMAVSAFLSMAAVSCEEKCSYVDIVDLCATMVLSKLDVDDGEPFFRIVFLEQNDTLVRHHFYWLA